MNFSALLVQVLLLTAAAHSNPVRDCAVPRTHNFRHVSDLDSTSFAPWKMISDNNANRDPQTILNAECSTCSATGWVARPIVFQVYVHIRDSNNTWTRRPYDVKVGCTCVRSKSGKHRT